MRALLFLSACLTTLALEPGPQDLDQAAGPAPGDEAPDFTLKLRDGKTKVTLSSFEGQKPVVLIFGSYS